MSRTSLFIVALGTIAALLGAACSADPPSVPAVPQDMAQTLESIMNTGPQLQRQIDNIENFSPVLISNCSNAYPERCIPLLPPDLDCEDITQRYFFVLPPDPHKFDPDENGIGCEQ